MEAGFLELIDTALKTGGNVGTIVILYFGMRAIKNASDAVKLLRSIKETLFLIRSEQHENFDKLTTAIERVADSQVQTDKDIIRMAGAIQRSPAR